MPVRNIDTQVSGDLTSEWLRERDRYTYQGQFILVMRMLRRAGWTVEPPAGYRSRYARGRNRRSGDHDR